MPADALVCMRTGWDARWGTPYSGVGGVGLDQVCAGLWSCVTASYIVGHAFNMGHALWEQAPQDNQKQYFSADVEMHEPERK